MILKLSLVVVVLAYVAALGGIFFFQRALLYFPDHVYIPPAKIKTLYPFQELSVTTEDGLDLTGWYIPAVSKAFTIVFFHGNGDSLRTIAFIANPYVVAGYGFLLAEYRGYSGLPGSPTETGLYADGRAFLNKLIASGIEDKTLILMAHSLGTGVATQMALEFNAGGLLLMAPFLSIPRMAQIRFPVFPAKYLTLDRYENFKKVPNLHLPLLIAHGGRDWVIPPSQGRQLFELANEPKQFHFMPAKDHTGLLDSDFIAASLTWLQAL
ncbi:MAG: alpha/beta fold hydrolase, partial [Beijerinckiaceae bacterium]|nr:alpha/beta fold hydrolase [Beijerinckiaceae bacterium]